MSVLSNHVGSRVGELGDDVTQRCFVDWVQQVLDDGEIDVSFFQKGDRPPGMASTWVEVQRHVFVVHVCNLRDQPKEIRGVARPTFPASVGHASRQMP